MTQERQDQGGTGTTGGSKTALSGEHNTLSGSKEKNVVNTGKTGLGDTPHSRTSLQQPFELNLRLHPSTGLLEINYRGFGHTNSPLAFGHNGAGGQLAWVDPASGISLAYLTSAHDRNEVRQGRRGVSIGNRAADLSA